MNFLHYTDKVIFLMEGKIREQGTYKELIENSVEFNNFIYSNKTPRQKTFSKYDLIYGSNLFLSFFLLNKNLWRLQINFNEATNPKALN